jgi:Chalcone isomerase-like
MHYKKFQTFYQIILGIVVYGLFLNAPQAMDVNSQEITNYLHTPHLIGKGTLRYLGFKVYDASFFSNDDHDLETFALRLEYTRKINKSDMLRATMEGMTKIGAPTTEIHAWETILGNIYPDVENGHTITAIYVPSGSTVFFHNGKQIGKINDVNFSKYFFSIWFAPQTNAPKLRHSLLGEHCAPSLISTTCEK